MLESVSQKAAPDVALIQGDIFEKNLDVRQRAVKTIDEIPHTGKFSQKNISELRFDPKQGFWATLIGTGMRVKLGEEQISLKSARVSQVIEYMETRQLEARVIDANLSKKVLVRLRKDP
jgi:cell division protein FtsQ